MTDHGDADDDDPQLGGLRSIWLSMPDEDPPERGLADLMAAARTKADEMAQPSLWQRIVAMMRRPPALALATVVVLVAGTVLVSNRRERFESTSAPAADQGSAVGGEAMMAPPPVATPTRSAAPAPSPASPGVAPSVETGNAAAFDSSSVEQKPAKAEADERGKARASRASAGKSKPVTSPAPTLKAAKASGDDSLDGEGATDDLAKKTDRRRDMKPAPEPELRGEKLQLAEPEAPAEETYAPVAGGVPAQTATADADVAPAKKPQQGAAQLHAQARTAASRNDCAAVKVMVQRIAKQDPAYYRANVTKDAAIVKCTGTH